MTDDDLINILLVDDDEDCLMFIRDAIADANIRNPVYEVTSGADALDFLKRRGPHADAPAIGLVYLDIEMPGMNGQDVLKAIRADRQLDHVPVVMMTGVTDDREKLEAAQNGANSYTVKPHYPGEFMQTVISATSYWAGIHRRPNAPTKRGVALVSQEENG
jgi:two-component system response regulator